MRKYILFLFIPFFLLTSCSQSDEPVPEEVTDYLIASKYEVMAYGMPYATMGKHPLGKPDYEAVCDDFHKFYSNYSVPCGTLSVTDLSQFYTATRGPIKITAFPGLLRQIQV